MAKTYTPIATTTLTSAAASYTFSSIPGTYTDLRATLYLKSTGTSDYGLRGYINGDTGANYSETNIQGYGSTATSSGLSSQSQGSYTFTYGFSNEGALFNFDFMNYANTNVYKTFLVANANNQGASGSVDRSVQLWRSTSAITSLTFFAATDEFAAGSTFTLYGILKA